MNNDEAPIKSKNIGLNQTAKSLLRNVIRHTDTHNRHKEESEMWNLYSKIKSNEVSDDDSGRGKERLNRSRERKYFKDQDIQHSFLYDDREEMESRRRGVKRAHMDDAGEGRGTDKSKSGGQSTYWLRQLHDFEAADPDRWGHSGFKELYPEVYDSDRSSPGATSPSKSHRKKKRKKKDRKEKDEPNPKKKMKKRRRSESDRDRTADVKHKARRKYSRPECQEATVDDKPSKKDDFRDSDSKEKTRTKRERRKDDFRDSDSKEKTRTKSSKRKKRKRYSKIENEKDRINDSDRDS